MKKLLIFCSGTLHLFEKIKKKKVKNVEIGKSIVEFFPDGELRQRFEKKLNLKGKDIFLVQSFFNDKNGLNINDKIIETLLAFHNAKTLGAKKIFLIAPYFPYLREDKRFEKNEAISARAMAWLFSCFDKVYIFEPHLHRLKSFTYFFPKAQRISLGDFIAKKIKALGLEDYILLGPDEESEQWVKPVAEKLKARYLILKKKRLTPEEVKVTLNKKIKEKNIVIIDDIASTGRTLLESVKKIKGKKVFCFVFHGLWINDDVVKELSKYVKLFSTNTVRLQGKARKIVNEIDVSGKIVEIVEKENGN